MKHLFAVVILLLATKAYAFEQATANMFFGCIVIKYCDSKHYTELDRQGIKLMEKIAVQLETDCQDYEEAITSLEENIPFMGARLEDEGKKSCLSKLEPKTK